MLRIVSGFAEGGFEEKLKVVLLYMKILQA
jgi:hypothetical protein